MGDVVRLIEAAKAEGDGVLATAIALAAVTGMRRGELCALRWTDIDIERGVLRVSRSLTTRGDQRWEGDTKTHQHRDVALDTGTLGLLELRRSAQQDYALRPGGEQTSGQWFFSSRLQRGLGYGGWPWRRQRRGRSLPTPP